MEYEYVSKLTEEEKTNYFKKLTTCSGEKLHDPFTLFDNWNDDIHLLPDITHRHVDSYLIDTPSPYTKESMKAIKLLDAYNYFVCGHVQ